MVKGAKFTNSISFTFNEFIPFLKYIHLHSRHDIFIHIQRQNFYSTLLYIHSTFCTHPSLRIIGSQAPALKTRDQIFAPKLNNMADEERSNERENEQTSPLQWEEVFSAADNLLEECEREWDSTNVVVRENIQIRLEYLIRALQQVLPIVRVNGAALNEILRNIRLCMDNGLETTHQTAQTLRFILSTLQKS